jgi:hypothetical protein
MAEIPIPGQSGMSKLFGGSGLVDKSMNPAISVNALFLGASGSQVFEPELKGLHVQEVEAAFTAAVDPYFFGNIIVTSEIGKPLTIEEAYAITLAIPMLNLKAGKMLTSFGKNNLIHTHAQPLIDRPLVNRAILGDDGFYSVGVEAALLVPVPWYFDFTLGAYNAKLAVPFKSTSSDALVGLARMEHLFDVSEVTTISTGASFSAGSNASALNSYFAGVDLTLKYISGVGRGTFAIAWTNEVIAGWNNGPTASDWERPWGAYSSLLFRLDQRFCVGGRGDYLRTAVGNTDLNTTGENLVLAYVPSEFSALRLQGGIVQSPSVTVTNGWQALLQYNMTIGSHPAHAY